MVRWRLREILDRENITAYRLNALLTPHIGQGTVYRWARKAPKQVDVSVLGWVVWGLRRLTGKPYTVCDILEFEDEPPQAEAGEARDRA